MSDALRLDACAVKWIANDEPIVKVAALSFRPGDQPADRIIAATARQYDLRVVTRDRRLLAYAEMGCRRALAC